jgi:hypothetical protein
MNGNDCIEQLENLCGEIHGRPMTSAETEAISKGNYYFDEDGGIHVQLDKP